MNFHYLCPLFTLSCEQWAELGLLGIIKETHFTLWQHQSEIYFTDYFFSVINSLQICVRKLIRISNLCSTSSSNSEHQVCFPFPWIFSCFFLMAHFLHPLWKLLMAKLLNCLRNINLDGCIPWMPQLPHSCSVESDSHYRCNFNEGFKSQCWLLSEDWPLKLETIVKMSLLSSCCIYLTHLLDLVFFLLCANSSFPPLCPSIPLLWYAFPTELCLHFWTSSVYYSGAIQRNRLQSQRFCVEMLQAWISHQQRGCSAIIDCI